MPARKPVPEPTPEQVERLMFRLLAHAGNGSGQQALFRIGKRAGVFWTHPDCTRPKGISMLTDEQCVHCGADRPAAKGARP